MEADSQAMKWPTYMPEADATLYQDFFANRSTERSAMPICIAMFVNQAKKVTCQKVNLIWPGRASPPVQIWVFASAHRSAAELIWRPVSFINWLIPTTPKARNTNTIQGAAILANRATIL